MVELKKICKSELKLRLLSFFHENQSTVDTSQAIAAWLNQDHSKIKSSLDCMVKQNILNIHRIGSTVAYGYTQDKTIIDEIKKFLKECPIKEGGGRHV